MVDRFLAKLDMSPYGCWLWSGGLGHYGYGETKMGGKREGAHRLAYKLLVGPIPDGLVLDHLCRVRLCCNPSHLEPVTIGENVKRGIGSPATRFKRQEFCKHGHTLADSYVLKNGNNVGQRRCKHCRRIRFLTTGK